VAIPMQSPTRTVVPDEPSVPPLRGALRLAEAAAYLGVARTKLYELTRASRSKSFHIGKTHLVSVRELDRLIAEHEELEAS